MLYIQKHSGNFEYLAYRTMPEIETFVRMLSCKPDDTIPYPCCYESQLIFKESFWLQFAYYFSQTYKLHKVL